MKATLGLEVIGGSPLRTHTGVEGIDGFFDLPWPCWAAKIIGIYGSESFKLEFLDGKRDYSRANSKGTRGIFVYYILESGFYYEVKNSLSWSKSERYFCKVDDLGDIVRVDKKEIQVFMERKIMKEWREKKDGMRQQTNDGD